MKNNAHGDADDENNYDNSHLFCREDDEDYDLWWETSVSIRNLLPTLSNHADIWFVLTVSRKMTVNYVDVENPIKN